MIWEGSTGVTLLHFLAKYFLITTATLHYQGQYIGFVKDKLHTQKPIPVLLQTTIGWEWIKNKGKWQSLSYGTTLLD